MRSADCSNADKRSSRSSGISKLISAWTAATSKDQRVMLACRADRCGLQHPLVAADDRPQRPGPFVALVAGERLERVV